MLFIHGWEVYWTGIFESEQFHLIHFKFKRKKKPKNRAIDIRNAFYFNKLAKSSCQAPEIVISNDRFDVVVVVVVFWIKSFNVNPLCNAVVLCHRLYAYVCVHYDFLLVMQWINERVSTIIYMWIDPKYWSAYGHFAFEVNRVKSFLFAMSRTFRG